VRERLRQIALTIPFLRHQLLTTDKLAEISEQLKQIQITLTQLPAWDFENLERLELQKSARFKDSKRLLSFSAKVNSQNGEDGIIAEIFNRIGTTNQIFVEIGVENGFECNTAFLAACGWSGHWIDSSANMVQTICKYRDKLAKSVKGWQRFITAENAVAIFEAAGVPNEFDLLSIDVDQNTYYIWEALRHYRPRVVVVEYNSAIPPSVDWRVQYSLDRCWDGTQNFGASLKALEYLGRQLGYNLVGCDCSGTNAFFVTQDICGDHFASPYDAENHFEPTRKTGFRPLRHPPALLDPL
jgi:hypothetical protein